MTYVDGFVLAVPADADCPTLRHISIAKLSGLRGHLWEQVQLPLYARGDLLVNFNYSGPVAKRNQLITVHDATVRAMPECFSLRYRLVQNAVIAMLQARVSGLMTVSEFSAMTNKYSALADGTRAQTMSSRGSGTVNRVRWLAVRLTNAIALAVRNIAVIRISVFILDFSFQVSLSGLNGFACLLAKENGPPNCSGAGCGDDPHPMPSLQLCPRRHSS
jgi:hypothetical protein